MGKGGKWECFEGVMTDGMLTRISEMELVWIDCYVC